MDDDRREDHWQELIELHDELDPGRAALPIRISRIDGFRIEASPKAVQLAQALACETVWSGISDARRRHSDLAA